MQENCNEFVAYQKFMSLLDEKYVWPCDYHFKFIIKPDQLEQLKELLADGDLKFKESKNGNYISVSSIKKMSSSIEVVGIYQKVSVIPGIVSL